MESGRAAPRRPFLTARWEHLVLLNYACPAALLAPLVPAGTTLDPWLGQPLVSLVGFRFEDTRLAGVPIPGHRRFDEVNLRFYVRRVAEDGTLRRAVVFIRELVPRRAIAAVARWIYNEPYLAVRMGHAIDLDPRTGGAVAYRWQHRGRRFAVGASVSGPAQPLVAGSRPSSSPSTTGATRGSATAARSNTKWRTRAGRCGPRTPRASKAPPIGSTAPTSPGSSPVRRSRRSWPWARRSRCSADGGWTSAAPARDDRL